MTRSINIPGGTAEVFTEDEITPRRLKPVTKLSLLSGSAIEKMQKAAADAEAAGEELPSIPPGLTDEEADRFADLQVVTAWAYLAGWSLDREVPATPDDMQDVPQKIVMAIAQAVSKAKAEEAKGFEAVHKDGTVADPESPTSA